MASFNQVKLRGGTLVEHNSFTGAPREVTVDTTLNTLRVHDGLLKGGHIICKKSELDSVYDELNHKIEDVKNDIGSSHNHDNLYSKLSHNHDSSYVNSLSGYGVFRGKMLEGHNGICGDNGSDVGFVRTPTSGILPYKSGGYSDLGSSSWRFFKGWFINADITNVNANDVYTKQLRLPGGDVRNQIMFGNNDYISFNDSSNEFDFLADDSVTSSRIRCGHIELGGKRIYIGSSFPSSARVDDILIQI